MHSPPVRAWVGLTFVVAVSFMIVLASRHLFSISAVFDPASGPVVARGDTKPNGAAYTSTSKFFHSSNTGLPDALSHFCICLESAS